MWIKHWAYNEAMKINKNLTDDQKAVLWDKATEAPFSGKFVEHKDSGVYVCAACGSQLFDSQTKYDSNCGWPSFYDVKPDSVTFTPDNSHGMIRTEVTCTKCGGHLGHIFSDGPKPTGQRYCINSLALDFDKK